MAKRLVLSGVDASAWAFTASDRLWHPDRSHWSFAALEARGAVWASSPEDATLILEFASDLPRTQFERLVSIVDRLLGPGGCPWDQAQTHETLKRCLLEETYEVFDAIDSGDLAGLREELGDLLLQPVMHAQMERLAGGFDIEAVAAGISDKLVRRHPHVFGETSVSGEADVLKNWDAIKKAEKGDAPRSILAGVPTSAPALMRAFEISKRAARAGFEWPDQGAVFDKLEEERRELIEAIESGDAEMIEAELGDLLFTAVNVARWSKVDPEEALRKMLGRFTARFQAMEAKANDLGALSPEAWDALWNQAKSEVG